MPAGSDYPLDQVLHAVEVVHTATSEEQRKQAETFLQNLEESQAAWEVCHAILDQRKEIRQRHFAARTLKAKIASSFDTVDLVTKNGVRDLILHHLVHTNNREDKPVLVALCVAIVDLALQMPTWKDALNDLINKYSADISCTDILIEILTLFPEELDNEKLRLTENRLHKLRDELRRVSPKVVTLLDMYARATTSVDMVTKIYRCLENWCAIGAVPFPDSMNTALFLNIFRFLSDNNADNDIQSACAGCLTSLFPDLLDEASKSSKSVTELVDSVLKYEANYRQAVQEEDIERAKTYAKIFAGAADVLIESSQLQIDIYSHPRFLDLLLTCSMHTDYEVVELLIDFWPKLAETANRDGKMANFKALLPRIITAIWQSCRYDADGDWLSPKKDEEFNGYRKHVWECIVDIDKVVGHVEAWETLLGLMATKSGEWDAVESILYMLSAFRVPAHENRLVPPVIQALTTMTGVSKLCFQHTVLILYGYLGEWFSEHPEYVDTVLMQVVNSLLVKELRDPASWALEELTKYNRPSLAKYYYHLLELMTRLDVMDIRPDEIESVSAAVTNLLNTMPLESILSALHQLWHLAKKPLEGIITASQGAANGKESNPAWREAASHFWLTHISTVFRDLNPQSFDSSDVLAVILDIIPVVQRLAVIYVKDDEMMESLVRCLRYMIRFIGSKSGAACLPVFAEFTDLFTTVQHSSIVYLAAILVDEFGEDANTCKGFAKMLDTISAATFSLLNSEAAIRSRPDLVDDFFRFCRRISEKMPHIMVFHPRLEGIMTLSLPCCLSTNHNANHSVFSFWDALLQNGAKVPELWSRLNTLVAHFASEMLSRSLRGVFKDSKTYQASDVARLIQDLAMYDQTGQLSQWLDVAISSLPVSQHADHVQANQAHVKEFKQTVLSRPTPDGTLAALASFVNLYK